MSFERGDLIFFGVMLAWSVYNVLQLRALPDVSFISRTCLYAFVGAAFSLPLWLREALEAPQIVFSGRALAMYLFLGIVPGIGAYAGLAFLAAKFGAVRASLDVRDADSKYRPVHFIPWRGAYHLSLHWRRAHPRRHMA